MVDAQPLSETEFARLKGSRSRPTAWQHVTAEWHRPSDSWQQTLRWTVLALADEWRRWQIVLPGLLRGDFIFTLALWVAVFTVAAAVVAQPSIPLPVRYSAGLSAVAYLYLYAELARIRRPLPGRRFLLGAADVAVVLGLGALSTSYVGYAHVLLFFAALRLASRFPDVRVVLVGLIMLLPFEVAGHTTLLTILLDTFTVVMTMLLVVQLTTMSATADGAIQRQGAVARLTSSLARVRDEEALFTQLASHAPTLGTNCAWAFWAKQAPGDEFRAMRWAGLPEGELPVFTFSPTLGADPVESVLLNGPLPGTGVGDCTLLQPTVGDGQVNGLITIAGRRRQFDAATRLLARQVAEEMGATLLRLQSLDEERQRTEAMEQANRLAGLAARHAGDQVAALAAILPAMADTLRSESLHLEWVDGDTVELVLADSDPLDGHAPDRLPLAGSRTADALLQGRPLREPMTGRRPEDLFMVPAGLRQVAVAPLTCAGEIGTLQLGRRLPRTYSAGELLVLQLLAERLGLLFAAGLKSSVANSAWVEAK
jgi:hypothetical protein